MQQRRMIGDPDVQFCLQQIERTDQYRLLKSMRPNKNIPAEYSEEMGIGTVDEMLALKKKILVGGGV